MCIASNRKADFCVVSPQPDNSSPEDIFHLVNGLDLRDANSQRIHYLPQQVDNNVLMLSVDAELDASATYVESSQSESDQYLELKLFRWACRWLSKAREIKLVERVSRSLIGLFRDMIRTRARVEEAQRDQSGSSHNEQPQVRRMLWVNGDRLVDVHSERARAKLLSSLVLSKLFNGFMIFCHSLLIIKSASAQRWSNHSNASREFSVDRLQSSLVELNENRRSTSWQHADEYAICYYWLLVSMLDVVNNLHWYNSKLSIETSRDPQTGRYKFRMTDITWFDSFWRVMIKPNHVFQLAYVGLLIGIGPISGSMGILITIYNSVNQLVRYGYNLYRVSEYHKIVESSPIVETLQLDENNNQVMEENEAPTGRCLLEDQSIKFGWSNWPVKMKSCDCNFRQSIRYKLERWQMMSQMLSIKLTIFTILVHLDSLSVMNNRSEFYILFASLVEAFLAMYFYYNKYQLRYSDSFRADLLDK